MFENNRKLIPLWTLGLGLVGATLYLMVLEVSSGRLGPLWAIVIVVFSFVIVWYHLPTARLRSAADPEK